jgi:hypothetical protein
VEVHQVAHAQCIRAAIVSTLALLLVTASRVKLTRYIQNGRVKQDEMGWACSMQGSEIFGWKREMEGASRWWETNICV